MHIIYKQYTCNSRDDKKAPSGGSKKWRIFCTAPDDRCCQQNTFIHTTHSCMILHYAPHHCAQLQRSTGLRNGNKKKENLVGV